MVRVNHPPGGATHFHTETAREPQTVRILKPPGGESSISFTDDCNSRTGSRPSTVRGNWPSPSSAAEEQSLDTKSAEMQSENSVIDGTDASLQNSSNGKASQEQKSVDPDPAGDLTYKRTPAVERSDEPLSDLKAEVSSAHFESEKLSVESVSDCSVEKDVISESQTSSECKLETSSTEVYIEENSEISSTSTEVQQTSKGEVSSSHENGIHEVNVSCVKASSESCENDKSEHYEKDSSQKTSSSTSNGVKSPNLPPLAVQHDQSSAYQPPSPSPSPTSPVKLNEDTRGRVFGRPSENNTPQPVQPRKIKDHMRSNIFMSDEDYTPTRSSRMNAPVNDTKQEVPAAGQRQRIPPGGFSTKLW